jgi:hypothetical protein
MKKNFNSAALIDAQALNIVLGGGFSACFFTYFYILRLFSVSHKVG